MAENEHAHTCRTLEPGDPDNALPLWMAIAFSITHTDEEYTIEERLRRRTLEAEPGGTPHA